MTTVESLGSSDPHVGEGGDLDDVCVVTHPLSSAGENATRTLLEILSALTKVALITADLPKESELRHRHEVVELSESGISSNPARAAIRFCWLQLKMSWAIYRRQEAVVLFFGATTYLIPIMFTRLIGRTVVLEPRGDVPLTLHLSWQRTIPAPIAGVLAGIVSLLEQLGFLTAHAIVTYTPGMAAQLELEKFQNKLFTNGARYVDTDKFRPTIPMSNRPSRIGFVGRLDEEKGIRTLGAVAKGLPEKLSFVFIGEGKLSRWLEKELRTEIADGSVQLTGWLDHDELPTELNKFKLLVMPSHPTEGLPTTILEAMACGTPVLANPVSGVPDVVRNGETGYLLDDTGPQKILSEITRILDNEDLSKIGDQARIMIESQYSFEGAVERYRYILTELES